MFLVSKQFATVVNLYTNPAALAVDQPFRFPASFTFVLRAFTTLEGIGETLNIECLSD